jgi:hypothetical protein
MEKAGAIVKIAVEVIVFHTTFLLMLMAFALRIALIKNKRIVPE